VLDERGLTHMVGYLYVRTNDGTLLDAAGRVIAFSPERFVREVCEQGCCFVCGASPGSREFNDEHVLPRWLLRRHDLFDREITLPNGTRVRYGRYTISCCVDCNRELGRVLEEPVSALFAGGYDAIVDHLRDAGRDLLFRWMALVYIKTHLRDATYRWHLDRRLGNEVIGDAYQWEILHHVHCLARSAISGVGLGAGAIGSFAALPVIGSPGEEGFDYGDMYLARSFYIRSGNVALVAVLNDAGAAQISFAAVLRRLTGPLVTPQVREILANFAFANLHLRERPRFSTVPGTGGLVIEAELPQHVDIDLQASPSRGELLAQLSAPYVGGETPEKRERILEEFRRGQRTYLFDADGAYVDYRTRLPSVEEP
jgi:hypothetical protein